MGVLMVYDITSRQSFEDMLGWLNEALKVSALRGSYMLPMNTRTSEWEGGRKPFLLAPK